MEGARVTVVNIGGLTNATAKLFHAPSGVQGGGLTVVRALVRESLAAGTTASSLRLIKGTNTGGTFAVNGTIDSAAVGGTASVFVAGIDKEWTIATPYVAAGEALAVIEGNVQACAAVTEVEIHWVPGK